MRYPTCAISAAVMVASVACAAIPAAAQVGKLYPVDEAATQPDFFTFRANLRRTAQTRDTASLYAVLAPNVLNSFGGDGG